MLRKFLKGLEPTEENKEMLNYDIERSKQIVKFNINLLRDKLLNSLERKKAEQSIAFEEWFIKDVEKVRNEIGTILAQK